MKAKRVCEVPSTGPCRSASCEKERGIQGGLDLVPGHMGGTSSRVREFEESRLLEDWGSLESLHILCTWHNLESVIFGSPLEGVEFFLHWPPWSHDCP